MRFVENPTERRQHNQAIPINFCPFMIIVISVLYDLVVDPYIFFYKNIVTPIVALLIS